jgi:non-specific serine/threonine protein kinase
VRAQAFLGLAMALGTREHQRAEQLLEVAVTGGRELGDAWALALALYGQGHLALVQGQPDRAQERWQTCAAVAQGVGNLYGLSYLQFRWGVLALLGLDLERATACLRESLRLSAELDSIREMAVAIAALALVAAAAGRTERPARLAGATQALLERAGCDLPAFLRGEYERGVAGVRERLGPRAFERAFAAGHALSVSSIVVEALGADDDACAAASDEFESGSAPQYAPLSAREWEVACLVARGLRNREIADHLVLAERTIGSHLERIFAKLQLSNRAQLAAWAVERNAPALAVKPGGLPLPVEPATREPTRRSARRLRLMTG